MKMFKKIMTLVLAVSMIMVSATGCQSKEEQKQKTVVATEASLADTNDTNATNDTTAKGGTINVHVGPEPNSIDPALNVTVDGGSLLNHAFEGLTKIDQDGIYVDAQAASHTVSEDGLVYTFTLRDDIRWSDGQSVKASDFVYAWQRLVDPATGAEYNYIIDMVQNANAIMTGDAKPDTLGIKALDDKTVEITLVAPCAYFLEICAFPNTFPVRQDIIEAYGDAWATEPEHYVSNGPYTLTEWDHQSKMVYSKNQNYYGVDALGPDQINFMLIEDWNSVLTAFKNGDILFGDELPSEEMEAMKGNGLYFAPQLGTYFLCINNQKEEFKDVNVRKALALAIDRQYIIDSVKKNGAVPADTFVAKSLTEPNGTEFHSNADAWYDTSDYDANVSKAQKLLEDAGYPNGVGFPSIEIMINPGHEDVAQAVQNMWQEKLGLNVTVATNDWAVFVETRQNGEYQIARHGWLADYNDPISFLDMWVSGGGNNDAKFSNEEYDKLIQEVKTTTDNNERYTKMHEAEKILGEEMPIIPIYYYTDPYLQSDSLRGVYTAPLGYKFFMYCETVQQ
ncbi:oligopeptide transport system substrate-binding protein [Lachnotalea glycerini]|uniref:Oligopeptide transport system substrate-binding protein n=2 Tax=Lachnotalea glycerini TaxID=1763509 RepID=A0A318EIH7_9FIRM|nr:peptide ABC transporter substrate-binding protein [Lachnotalea glycerini]PXV85146.1 oligopeptide transport system substrate-binding protein [Lachnotalea glycerini]